LRVAVTGANGKLATALRPYFPTATWLSRESLDVANQRAVRQHWGSNPVDLVIHCGAETRHDATGRSLLYNNVCGSAFVSGECIRLGARLVYASTDYVYSGVQGLHKEWEPVLPVNDYARSKLAGEYAALANPNTLVIRGSWYTGMNEWKYAASNCYTSKIPVATAAGWIAQLSLSTHTGVMNVGGARRSMYEIALETNQDVKPVPRDNFNLPYLLPADVSLDTGRMRRALGIAR